MEATAKKVFEVTLKLNEEEAIWLKEIMQNPINVSRGQEEPGENYRMRFKFFAALKTALSN